MLSKQEYIPRAQVPRLLEIVPPADEPIGVDDYLNAGNIKLKTQRDVLLRALVSAREAIEGWTGRPLVTRTIDQIIDFNFQQSGNINGLPYFLAGNASELKLRATPVRKVLSITVTSPELAETVVDASVYSLSDAIEPYRTVFLRSGQVWPGALTDVEAFRIRTLSGYATPVTGVDVSTNVLTAINHPYENGDVVRFTMSYNDDKMAPSLPSPLQVGRNYYVVGVSGDTFQLSLTSGGSAIDITDQGSGRILAGEIPTTLIKAIIDTAAVDFLKTEEDEVSTDGSGIPQRVRDRIRRYKRDWNG